MKVNQKFGTNFTEQDKVLLQLKADMMKDEQIVKSAKTGNKTTYNALSDKRFDKMVMERFEENESFFQSLFSDKDKLKFIKKLFLAELYDELRNKED